MVLTTVYKVLFENANEGIFLVNKQGVILLANESLEKLFGYKSGELINKPLDMLIPRKTKGKHSELMGSYFDRPSKRYIGGANILYGLRSDGIEIPVEISLSPYVYKGESFTLAFVIEISERLAAEEKLRQHQRNLERMVEERTLDLTKVVEELEIAHSELNQAFIKERELNELKSKFVTVVSHEFRTPLATMSSSLSLIRNYVHKEDPAKILNHVERIKSSINHLSEMLNDVLEVNRIEEQKFTVVPESLDLTAFVKSLKEYFEPLLVAGKTLTLSVPENLEVESDKKLLRHILQNLISNAIKFSFNNSEIALKLEENGEDLLFSIKNQGLGIPDDDVQHIFEPFFRGQNTGHIVGTGLGLNIAHQYAMELKGRIFLESEVNRSTTFYLSLPRHFLNEKKDSHN